jgi:hypothetical protein
MIFRLNIVIVLVVIVLIVIVLIVTVLIVTVLTIFDLRHSLTKKRGV